MVNDRYPRESGTPLRGSTQHSLLYPFTARTEPASLDVDVDFSARALRGVDDGNDSFRRPGFDRGLSGRGERCRADLVDDDLGGGLRHDLLAALAVAFRLDHAVLIQVL